VERNESIGKMMAEMWDTARLHNYKYLNISVLNIIITAVTIKTVFHPHNYMINTNTQANESRPSGATAHLTFHWLLHGTA
jgi:hypothetical protein